MIPRNSNRKWPRIRYGRSRFDPSGLSSSQNSTDVGCPRMKDGGLCVPASKLETLIVFAFVCVWICGLSLHSFLFLLSQEFAFCKDGALICVSFPYCFPAQRLILMEFRKFSEDCFLPRQKMRQKNCMCYVCFD